MAKAVYYTYEVTVDGETKSWSESRFDFALADFLGRGMFTSGKIEKVAHEWEESG